jgi:hypothetical protein
MNEVFSFRRFRRLFVKHTIEHYRTYLMSVAVLVGVLLLGGSFIFYMMSEPPDPGFQTVMFVSLLLMAGTLFTSTIFSDYGDKNKAIPALTLPATALEKFLVGWLYSYPIFLIVYTGAFYLALLGLSSSRHWGEGQHFQLLNLRQPGMGVLFLIYSVLQAVSLFGAIFFRKLNFIKTGFAFFIALGVAIFLNTLLLQTMTGLGTVKPALPFGFLNFYVHDRYYSISLNDPGSEMMILYILMLVTLLMWIAAYFRLKEKQV